jgi:sulfur transfer complex TusBCD TusB component (DsrH family)
MRSRQIGENPKTFAVIRQSLSAPGTLVEVRRRSLRIDYRDFVDDEEERIR